MRALAVITALLLVGCAFWRAPEKKEKKAAAPQVQQVPAAALSKALTSPMPAPEAVKAALDATEKVSKVVVSERKADSEQATNAETVKTVTTVAAIGLAVSLLAFFFGSYVGITKLAAVSSSILCLSVAVAAPAILQALVTHTAQIVIISCFGILGVSVAVSVGWVALDKAIDYARRSR